MRVVRRGFLRQLIIVTAVLSALTASARAATPFVNEVADGPFNEVGPFNSLALDAQGNPHVSYLDDTDDNLKYAQKSGGVWTIETADGPANDVGRYSSLALDAQGNPHVSYYDFTMGNLKYARKSGGVWTVETADGSANDVGPYSSLALDAQGNPHVSYYDATAVDLKYARKSGGVWTIEYADVAPGAVGAHTSLVLDAEGNAHVSYFDNATGDLKYARRSIFNWTREIADGSANIVGFYTSIALDAQGNPHVSYFDDTADDLKYARKSGGLWTTEIVDASGTGNVVGFFTSLVLDAQGNPAVSYHDATAVDLKYARKSGGVWTIETTDGSANFVGWYTSLALDAQGNPHVSYGDLTTGYLKYASAAVRVVSPLGAVTWPVGSLQQVQWSGVGPVDICLAVDGGGADETLATDVIANTIALRVPHLPTRFARIVVDRISPPSTAASDSFFTINATIALLKFDATPRDEDRAVAVSWQTAPGPEADVRYRIERAPNESSVFAPAHGGLLNRGEYVDSDPGGASVRYRLIAVNGLGEEYALGETVIAPALAGGRSLAVSPSVARGGGVQVAFRVASELLASDVSIFDASGRLVRRLVSGSFPGGVHSVSWDGRDDQGATVSAGVYLVRLGWGGQMRETQRVTLVR
jgi:subtilisin-like proprotein convertase family protein